MMSRSSIYLGRIFGIPVQLDYSWFLIFIMLTWSLATNYFPAEFGNWPVAQYWGVGAASTILMFASVLLHEIGHSVVALYYKIPVRNITLFIFGGMADIGGQPPKPSAEFWIALAGPAANFLLAIFFGLLQPLTGGWPPLFALFRYLAFINLSLAVFNMIPGIPLDGGRAFLAIIWGITHNFGRATFIAATLGRIIAFLLILLGVWQIYTGNLAGGVWTAFVGWFMENAAASRVQQQTIHDLLAGRPVSSAMRRDYATVGPGETLEQVIHEHILGSGHRSLIVEENGRVAGLLTIHELKKIPRAVWPATTVAQIMIPFEQMERVRPEMELAEALGKMDRNGVNRLPVMIEDQMQGMLGRDDVIGLLCTLGDLAP